MPISRREFAELVFPFGWTLGALEARSLNPGNWSKAAQVGLAKDVALFLPACGPAIPTPPTIVKDTPTPVSRQKEWSPGQPREEMRMGLVGPNNERSVVEITNFTDLRFRLNSDTLAKLINLYHQQGGTFPPEARIWFVEKDLPYTPESPAYTDIKEDLIVLSLGRVLRHPEDYTPEGYWIGEMINGILAGQLCYLMAGESRQMDLEGRPQTPENMKLVCGSCGVMVAAIMAGKEYQGYLDDVKNKFWYTGGAELLHFDPGTYQVFLEAFQEPLLIFEQTPISPLSNL